MALNFGIPVWPQDGDFHFEGEDRIDLDNAIAEMDAAHEAWHVAVDGTLPDGTRVGPRNEAIAAVHDAIKTRTGTMGATVHPPLWDAQESIIGRFPRGAPDEAIMQELKQAYITHAGPETTRLVEATRRVFDLEIELHGGQRALLDAATTLPGNAAGTLPASLDNELFLGTADRPGGMKAFLLQQFDDRMARPRTLRPYLEQYIAEMPALRLGRPLPINPPPLDPPPIDPPPPIEPPRALEPPPARIYGDYNSGVTIETLGQRTERMNSESASKAAEVLEQQATHTRGGSGWLIAGIAAGAGLGAYVLSQKKSHKTKEPSEGNSIKTDTVQLGASQTLDNQRQDWTTDLNADPANPSSSISK